MILDSTGNPVNIAPLPVLGQKQPNSVDENTQPKAKYSEHLTPNQRAFLSAFARTGTITHAAEAADVHRRNHNVWLTDPVYARAFMQAKEEAADYLEGEARRRAVEGVEEPTGWYQGRPGGYITKYSDTLLIFLMKGAFPEKYRERMDIQWDGRLESLTAGQLENLEKAMIERACSGDPARIEAFRRELEGPVIEGTSEVVDLEADRG
jgi:hypothetical protein